MEPPISTRTTERAFAPTTPPSIGSSIGALLGFFVLVSTALVAATYPLAALATLTALVAVLIGLRSLAGRTRGTLRRIDFPGLGTVEFRFLRA
ncbi:hypothetical protein GRS48_01960 [Halorubrum sp. JWXQ-INN 858]|uniref:hypothetical protein n=1 Tax=Halorubrum sp. JWXQ-INN 858 TaxID=2690782 RepID=UPI0013593A22|nr:hypothetical protein [Halorubrum sp. JWXQ-INN 858]MWV63592.1 hypothetical protein [Halorubrum sp. JWXQ-INN 858]